MVCSYTLLGLKLNSNLHCSRVQQSSAKAVAQQHNSSIESVVGLQLYHGSFVELVTSCSCVLYDAIRILMQTEVEKHTRPQCSLMQVIKASD